MAEPIPTLVPLIGLPPPFSNPSFELWVSPLWNGKDTPNRVSLRRSLKERLHDLGDSSPYSQICSLAFPPVSSSHGISISHTEGMGGFLISQTGLHIGLDIEREGRVSEATLARVYREPLANSVFATDLSDPTYIWVALEASFKAGSKHFALNVVSDLRVSFWNKLGQDTYSYGIDPISSANAKNSLTIQGCIFKAQGFLISTAAIFP